VSSDFVAFLAWYLAASVAGLLALPVAFQLFRRLPDRGYALARPLGLLLIGYVFWLLGSLGFLRNDVPSLLFAALLVGGLGAAWLGRAGLADLARWLRQQRATVIGLEALFLAAFALLAVIRAYNPDIFGTEKPMEFMFINSILRSPTFPPQDAWLSGHAISYYYFGYVLVAALARATATDSAVAFNLGLALLFALTAVAAQGVTLNLIALAQPRLTAAANGLERTPAAAGLQRAFWPALLGPALVLVAGNFYGLVQLAYANGWFAESNIWAARYYFGALDPANTGRSAEANPPLPAEQDSPGVRASWVNLWDWLDLKQAQDPTPPPPPDGFTWDVGGNWFFAARVVHDKGLLGNEVEAIDEMPSFSFILGDMHPHVLALPFVVLAIGLALEWLLWGAEVADGQVSSLETKDQGRRTNEGELKLSAASLRHSPFVFRLFLSALLLGGLSFLNTWDFPIYLFLTVLALAAGLGLRRGWAAVAAQAGRLVLFGLGLAVLSVALYFPFYLTFQSQAGGLLPNLIWPTRFQQTVVFFGPVLVGAMVYVAWLAARSRRMLDRSAALWSGLGLVGVLVLVVALLAVLALRSPTLGGFVDGFISPLTRGEALRLAAARRVVDSLATLFPAALIGLAVGLIVGALRRGPAEAVAEPEVFAAVRQSAGVGPAPGVSSTPPVPAPAPRPWRRQRVAPTTATLGDEALLRSPVVLMALAMLLTGALLLVGPEWLYLRDNFGYRMNTIFKFYFQTWTLWALASAFGLWHLRQHARPAARTTATLVVGLAFAGSLVYTLPSLYSKTGGFAGPPTLDGMAYFAQRYPEEWAAINWLEQNVDGPTVIVEAAGGAYQIEEGRIATGTGLPTVIGWTNHEGQWRGDYYSNVAERPGRIETLYQVRDWPATEQILDEYGIEYVIVGTQERRKYNPIYEPKFDINMDTVFETGNLIIYRRKPSAAAQ
jgi:uncharacterized membrane protein